MVKKIEHIGIAVKNLSTSIPLFEKLLAAPCYKTEVVETEKVKTAFFQTGETKIELLESDVPGSAITSFLEKRGEGVHHIALAVDDIYAEMRRLQNEGFELIHTEPKDGADNKLICFLHPKSSNGVLIELVMDKPVAG